MTKDSQARQPLEPQGQFRWLHAHYSMIRFEPGGVIASESGFGGESTDAAGDGFGAHAWEAGLRGRMDLLDKFWETLTPLQRGAALAGVSEINGGMKWIPALLPSCELTAVTTCELACNAVRRGRIDILATVLNSSTDLTGEVRRYERPGRSSGMFSEVVSKLACRCIDLVLEAAIIHKNLRGIRMALDLGANPNIPIWVLRSSSNEKHCALSFCIKNQMKGAVNLLLAAAANPRGIPFCSPNEPLYQAISKSDHALAIRLLKRGASFAESDPNNHRKAIMAKARKKRLICPAGDHFFGHFETDLSWVRDKIGSLITLVPVDEKPCFYEGSGQGGRWFTFLDSVGGDVAVIRRYEKQGLDSRLSAEEFLSIVNGNAYHKLIYLLKKVPEPVKARILFRVRRRNPSFGSDGPMALLPQDDRASEAVDFDPGSQEPLVLPDGSALFINLDSIAAPGHSHGPCLKGHFWHLTEEPVFRRRGERTIMKRIRSTWKMVEQPANFYQLKSRLRVVRRFEGRFIRLGCSMANLGFFAPDEKLAGLIRAWSESPAFQEIEMEARRRILAQDHSNARHPELVLTEVELDGYPKEFWPFLDRLESGLIGMRPDLAGPAMLRDYRAWERKNKREDSFVPDPRILDFDIWAEVPPELKPFLVWDDLFDRPGFGHKHDTEYEKAMNRKATRWWNNWIAPQILKAIEEK